MAETIKKCPHCDDGVVIEIEAVAGCCGNFTENGCCGGSILEAVQVQAECNQCEGTGEELEIKPKEDE